MTALVYGFIRAASHGWSDHLTLAASGSAAVVLTLFTAILDVCSLLVIIALIKIGRLAPVVAPAARPKEEAVAS